MSRSAPPLWRDREQAGRALARQLLARSPLPPDALLLGLPRGGVAVAAAMAPLLQRPLRSWCVRKVADPAWPERALGAIGADGLSVWREGIAGPDQARARREGWLAAQERELERRRQLYGDPEDEELRQRPLIVVDDGIATGMTAQAALLSLRTRRPASLLLAVPLLDRSLLPQLAALVERLEVLEVVADLRAVGEWYEHFPQLSDAEVLKLLAGRGG